MTELGSEKYLKKLIGRTEIEDALKRLDNLTQEEARMATAQVLKVAHTVDERVRGVADEVLGVDNRVAGVDDKVAIVNDKVTRVEDSVAHVDNRVTHVDDSVAHVDNRVAGVDDRVASVGEIVKIVDDKVTALIDGAQYTFNQSLKSV